MERDGRRGSSKLDFDHAGPGPDARERSRRELRTTDPAAIEQDGAVRRRWGFKAVGWCWLVGCGVWGGRCWRVGLS
jgi:hypothetical protein